MYWEGREGEGTFGSQEEGGEESPYVNPKGEISPVRRVEGRRAACAAGRGGEALRGLTSIGTVGDTEV
jgi:hypothetical protein